VLTQDPICFWDKDTNFILITFEESLNEVLELSINIEGNEPLYIGSIPKGFKHRLVRIPHRFEIFILDFSYLKRYEIFYSIQFNKKITYESNDPILDVTPVFFDIYNKHLYKYPTNTVPINKTPRKYLSRVKFALEEENIFNYAILTRYYKKFPINQCGPSLDVTNHHMGKSISLNLGFFIKKWTENPIILEKFSKSYMPMFSINLSFFKDEVISELKKSIVFFRIVYNNKNELELESATSIKIIKNKNNEKTLKYIFKEACLRDVLGVYFKKNGNPYKLHLKGCQSNNDDSIAVQFIKTESKNDLIYKNMNDYSEWKSDWKQKIKNRINDAVNINQILKNQSYFWIESHELIKKYNVNFLTKDITNTAIIISYIYFLEKYENLTKSHDIDIINNSFSRLGIKLNSFQSYLDCADIAWELLINNKLYNRLKNTKNYNIDCKKLPDESLIERLISLLESNNPSIHDWIYSLSLRDQQNILEICYSGIPIKALKDFSEDDKIMKIASKAITKERAMIIKKSLRIIGQIKKSKKIEQYKITAEDIGEKWQWIPFSTIKKLENTVKKIEIIETHWKIEIKLIKETFYKYLSFNLQKNFQDKNIFLDELSNNKTTVKLRRQLIKRISEDDSIDSISNLEKCLNGLTTRFSLVVFSYNFKVYQARKNNMKLIYSWLEKILRNQDDIEWSIDINPATPKEIYKTIYSFEMFITYLSKIDKKQNSYFLIPTWSGKYGKIYREYLNKLRVSCIDAKSWIDKEIKKYSEDIDKIIAEEEKIRIIQLEKFINWLATRHIWSKCIKDLNKFNPKDLKQKNLKKELLFKKSNPPSFWGEIATDIEQLTMINNNLHTFR